MDHRAANRRTEAPERNASHVEITLDDPDLADGQSRRPLRPQDVQTDGAVGVDVWVVDSSGEGHLR